MGFRLIGWVLMPEHFHLLVKPEPAEATSRILQDLKKQTALRILRTLREHRQHRWCQQMLVSFRLPPTVHDESRYRVWQRRFYPFNVYSEEKRLEKLNYMHGNPVKRGMVSSPDQWPWSSFRFYYLNDASVLAMDRLT
jgi:putative transposase